MKILKSQIGLVKDIEIDDYETDLKNYDELWSKYKNEKVELRNQNGEIINICKKCGGYMKIVKWRGDPFLGCSNYPDCRSSRRFSELYRLGI